MTAPATIPTKGGPRERPVPADFDPSLPLREACIRYSTSKTTAHRWRREVGYSGPGGTISPWTERDVYLLRTNFNGMTYTQLVDLLGRSAEAIKAKAKTLGLKKAQGNFARDSRPVFHGQRAQGVADMAAQHLRRDAPVFRADADGSANPKGKFWRFGNITLTEDEMLAKAERKGWSADAWREIPRSGLVTIGEAANSVLAGMKVIA
jgi:hypothetical protein